eukprot:1158687-Pelagomonas_calceolata.AAC.10
MSCETSSCKGLDYTNVDEPNVDHQSNVDERCQGPRLHPGQGRVVKDTGSDDCLLKHASMRLGPRPSPYARTMLQEHNTGKCSWWKMRDCSSTQT